MPTFGDGAVFAHPILSDNVRRANYKPTEEEVVSAKALINFLMQDRFFLALYRSSRAKSAPKRRVRSAPGIDVSFGSFCRSGWLLTRPAVLHLGIRSGA